MPFFIRTLNAFEMTHREASCEIPAKRDRHRAFVHIYPPRNGITAWRIKRFEVPAHLVSASLYDGDLLDLQFVSVTTLAEVEDVLRHWAISPTLFDAPWKCDSPM